MEWSISPWLLLLLMVVPGLLYQRDVAVLLANRKPSAPAYGAIYTVDHGPEAMTRIVSAADGIPAEQFSNTFDMYVALSFVRLRQLFWLEV
jgi:hypothetical protein